MSDAAGSDALRRGLRDSADPRAERTRRRLFEAAQALCDRGEDVTAAGLAREAKVSRSVFYTHFSDVGELAARMIEPVLGEIAAEAAVARDTDPHRAMRDAHERVATHVNANRVLYRAAFRLPGDALLDGMREAMRVALAAHIDMLRPAAGIRTDIAAGYVAAAATNVLADWVTDQIQASPSEIAHHLHVLMPSWMHEPINEPSEETARKRGKP